MREGNIAMDQMNGTLVSDLTVAQHTGSEEARWPGELFRRACSFPAMCGAMLVGAVFANLRAFYVDPDLWWHLRTGELILSTHRWATTDLYSYTSAGTPYLFYE